MKIKQALSTLTILALATVPARADGPAFTNDVTISHPNPDVLFTDTEANEADWEICVDGSCLAGQGVDEAMNFSWADEGSSAIPVVIESGTSDSLLYLAGTDRIGIGTSTPSRSLEIESTAPEIVLDDTSAGAGEAYFELNNNIATLEGNGGTDIIQYDVRGPVTMNIAFDGTTTFQNDVQVNSSRASKTAVEAVDGGDVLARLVELPIAHWSYKTQGEGVRHLGPMAEDFHAAFALGATPSAISVVDVAGVALAAARELAVRVRELEVELAVLREDGR